MASRNGRRVDVPAALQAGDRFADAGYAWAYQLSTPEADARTPEQWVRGCFEDAPAPLRAFLTFGWKVGLGLRMGPRGSTGHILGWHIRRSDADAVTIEADSRVVRTRNVVTTTDDAVTWVTFVGYTNTLGRVLWAAARPVHQLLVPISLQRVANSSPK